MTQKKIYKVLTPIQKREGGTWFMKIGSGYTNKDDSINLYLDAIPVGGPPGRALTIQIRELDENDLRQREANRAGYSRSGSGGGVGGESGGFDAPSGTGPSHGLGASESLPF